MIQMRVTRATHVRRWLTAFVLLGVIVPVLFWGGKWPFLALVVLVVALCQLEYEKLAGLTQSALRRVLGILVALCLPSAAMMGGERGLMISLAGAFMIWMAVEMVSRKELGGVSGDLGRRMLGYLYAALLPSYFVLLWRLPGGVHWILFTVTITAVGDTAAYYVGSIWGRHRLMPRISPNKTVEGALAGLGGNVLGALSYAALLFPARLTLNGILLALTVGCAGQVGDLSESMLKRASGLKDSGGLLPGHGGVLDRLDSLLFSVPIVYYWAIL